MQLSLSSPCLIFSLSRTFSVSSLSIVVHFFWRGHGFGRVGQDGCLATWSWRSGVWFSVGVDRVGRDRRAVEIDVVRGFWSTWFMGFDRRWRSEWFVGFDWVVEIGWVVTRLVWIQIGWFGGGVVIRAGSRPRPKALPKNKKTLRKKGPTFHS